MSRVAIIGGGKVGSHLAAQLCDRGHTVAVAEIDHERARRIGESSDLLVFEGDGTDVGILTAMDVDRADWVLAVTGHDEDNLVACQLAKTLGAGQVIARLNNPANEESFRALDVPTLSVTTLISDLISEEVDVRQSVRRASLGSGEIILLELVVPDDAPIRLVSELRLPQPAVLVTIVRGEKVLVPGARTEVRPGDEVLAVTRSANEPQVRAVLCEGREPQGD